MEENTFIKRVGELLDSCDMKWNGRQLTKHEKCEWLAAMLKPLKSGKTIFLFPDGTSHAKEDFRLKGYLGMEIEVMGKPYTVEESDWDNETLIERVYLKSRER